MTISNLDAAAKRKGINVLGCGDCLLPAWFDQIAALPEVAQGTFEAPLGTRFIISGEIEDKQGIHHLFFLPSVSAVRDLRARLQTFSPSVDRVSRPKVNLMAEAIANLIVESGGIVGPAHAFLPWTSVFRYFHSLRECYRSAAGRLAFVELGTVADSDIASRVSQLEPYPFLTFSDSFSPLPHKLGRAFTAFNVEAATFEELALALKKKDGRDIAFNAGPHPQESKFYCTACTKCFHKFSIEEARSMDFKCISCGSRIGFGLKERMARLTDSAPSPRPPYRYTIPLNVLIQKSVGGPLAGEAVSEIYEKLTTAFGNELHVLFEVPPAKLAEINSSIATTIERVRSSEFILVPGGGGKPGELIIPPSKETLKKILAERANEINCVSGIPQKPLITFINH